MKIRVFDDPADLSRALASRIADALSDSPGLVLGLATGRTPVAAYAELAALAARGAVDFSGCTSFNLDEFVGLPADHPRSFRQYMRAHLFDRVNLDPSRINFLDGCAQDLEAECRRYETAIASVGGIDVQILGVGTNGHIAFNEPGESVVWRTHRAELADSTRADNASLFGGNAEAVPPEALTMGVGTILEARTILLAGTGDTKAAAIAAMVSGPVTPWLPASFLQQHRNVEVYVDRAAAARLGPLNG